MQTQKSIKKSLIIAHRGASAHAPENTMASFRLAYEQGADGIELDVMLSQDKHLVIMHDFSLDRTTNGKGRVVTKSWERMRELDAGSSFSPDFAGEKIPLLNDVLEEFGGKMLINIELKGNLQPFDDLSTRVHALVCDLHLQDSVIISSFTASHLIRLRYMQPRLRLGLLTMPTFAGSWTRGLMDANHYDALHPYYEEASLGLCARMHAWGKKVNVWTVDKPDDLLRMQSIGVDAVICNDPLAARQVLSGG